MAHERIGPAVLALFQEVMFALGHLTRSEREMVAAVTSAAQGCHYRARALCVLAERMTLKPTEMVEEDWRPLRDLGFDNSACLEVAHLIASYNYWTRLADGLGVQLDPATQAASESGVALVRRD